MVLDPRTAEESFAPGRGRCIRRKRDVNFHRYRSDSSRGLVRARAITRPAASRQQVARFLAKPAQKKHLRYLTVGSASIQSHARTIRNAHARFCPAREGRTRREGEAERKGLSGALSRSREVRLT